MLLDGSFDRVERDGTNDEDGHDQISDFGFWILDSKVRSFLQARAYSTMSGALSNPETIATRCAPATITCSRLSILIPPMQKIGRVTSKCTRLMSLSPIGR